MLGFAASSVWILVRTASETAFAPSMLHGAASHALYGAESTEMIFPFTSGRAARVCMSVTKDGQDTASSGCSACSRCCWVTKSVLGLVTVVLDTSDGPPNGARAVLPVNRGAQVAPVSTTLPAAPASAFRAAEVIVIEPSTSRRNGSGLWTPFAPTTIA